MRTIAVFVDIADKPSSARLLDVARDVVRGPKPKLYLVDIESPETEFDRGRLRDDRSRDSIAQRLRHRHHALHILETELRHLAINATAMMVRGSSARGSPLKKVLQEVQRLKPDLVVIGSHQHSMLHHLFSGSVSSALIHRVSCPVLIVPQKKPSAPTKRRTAADFSRETIVSIR